LVLAGPGSGKTRIIVERFHRLLALGSGAQQQLVLTYTRKAADEMRVRVEAVLDELRPPLLWNPLRPHDLMDPLLDIIGTAKQELVTPDAYAAWASVRLETSDDPAERIVLERHADVAR